jgi:hypothetical protein
MTGLWLLALLQSGTVTVGDTVGLERVLGAIGGVVVRPQPWKLGSLGQQLGPAKISVGPEGTVVRYHLVLWYPGDHTLTMPGPIVVRQDGRSDTLAASTARIRVTSVLPAGERRADIPPRPPSRPIPLEARTLLPVLFLVLAVGLLLLPIALRWRRQSKVTPAPAAAGIRPGADVITRWAEAGEYRAALDGWGWVLARRLAISSDLAEIAELQRVLEEISFGAYSPQSPEQLASLCQRAAKLGAA